MEPPSSITVELLVLSFSILGLIICSALISGSEAAFFSLTPGQRDALKQEGDSKGERVLWLLSNPDYLLGTILQANNIVNILIVLLSTMLLGKLFDFSSYPVVEYNTCNILPPYFWRGAPKDHCNQFPGTVCQDYGISSLYALPCNKAVQQNDVKIHIKVVGEYGGQGRCYP